MLRKDDLENGYHIWQDTDLFCFGIDAVLLAHFPDIRNGERIVDLGTGFAPIPLIMRAAARDAGKDIRISALEIGERAAALAARSVEENGLAGDIEIKRGDIKEAAELYPAASFSLVVSNPPYIRRGSGILGGDPEKAAARAEVSCTFRDVAAAASYLLPVKGRFAFIHRPSRLPEIMVELRRVHLEPKRMRMIHPFRGSEASMVLIEAVKCGGPELKTEPPLVVSEDDGSYTLDVLRIYGKA